jgi:hypothetical protein
MDRLYISIGSVCIVSRRLREIQVSQETLFFDWLITSFTSVVEILSIKTIMEIKEKLSTNITFETQLFEGHQVVSCNHFHTFKSLHDLPDNGSEPAIFKSQFIDKYCRRYLRIISLISKKPDITFVHYIDHIESIERENIVRFFNTLRELNETNEFKLVILCKHATDECALKSIRNIPSVTCEILDDYIKSQPDDTDWTLSYLNWSAIWKKVL